MGHLAQASAGSHSGKCVCRRSEKAFVTRRTAEDWGGAAGQVGEGEGGAEEGGVATLDKNGFAEIRFAIAIVLFAIVVPSNSQTSKHSNSRVVCEKVKLFRQHRIVAWSSASSSLSAVFYVAGLAVDADGAFRAYHPTDRLGLDAIVHAGHPGNWWALATDTGETNGRPVLQRKGDPAPGYYVSITSLYDAANLNEHDPHRYVNAAKIPYVVLPPVGLKHAKLGDFATVVNLKNSKIAAAIVADESAPELKLGEGSIALADALGIDSNPRYGGSDGGVAFVIYPDSGNGKPRALEDIIANSQHQFQKWGGLDKLHACLTTP
jgi:Fungal chitosanase of glycosyl hydrolase group 75